MHLEKLPLAANGHAMPMKGQVTIQPAFHVAYTSVIEHMVFVSRSPEAQMNILGMNFLAKFGELFNQKNPMLFSTVFPGICVKLSLCLDKFFPYYSQVNSVELLREMRIAPDAKRFLSLLAKDENKHLFRKRKSFSLHKHVLSAGIYTYLVYSSHEE